MYLDDVRTRLVELVRKRVQSGQFTERGLARLSGMSQPHLHNVLKQIRTLSLEAADQLLSGMKLGVEDLILRFPYGEDLGTRAVPSLNARVGPGISAQFLVFGGYYPVPAKVVSSLVDPIMAQVAPDLGLPVSLQVNDIVLVDQNPAFRRSPLPDFPYLIASGNAAVFRYVRLGGTRIYLTDSPARTNPKDWHEIPLMKRDILEVVRGRVVWISREIGKTPSGPSFSLGEGD